MKNASDHFSFIFWYIVGVTIFGAGLTIFAMIIQPRCVDIALTFWLSSAVAGCIGYLIGSSVGKKSDPPPGTTTAEVSATLSTTPTPEA